MRSRESLINTFKRRALLPHLHEIYCLINNIVIYIIFFLYVSLKNFLTIHREQNVNENSAVSNKKFALPIMIQVWRDFLLPFRVEIIISRM